MSLADKFENQAEPAFTRGFDRESAQRQLRMSILLVVAMAIAAFVLGLASPVNTKYPPKETAVSADSEFSGRLVSVESR